MVKSNLAYKAQDTVVPEVVVNESPIKWCAVALSDVIARGKRLEASVFDVEAKQFVDCEGQVYSELHRWSKRNGIVVCLRSI